MSTMGLQQVLENEAGQDVAESIMKHLTTRRHENMLHLVSKRMHGHAYRSNVPIVLNMDEMNNTAQRVAYLANVDENVQKLNNVQGYSVRMNGIASVPDARRCLYDVLRLDTEKPRTLSRLAVGFSDMPLLSDAERKVGDFLADDSVQSRLGLAGLDLRFSDTDNTHHDAPDFVRRLTTLESLVLRARYVADFAPNFQDLVHLKKLSIGRRSEDGNDGDLPVREFPSFINALPVLEHLDMSGFFEEDTGQGPAAQRVVDLKHLVGLTYLDLSDNYLMEVCGTP